MTNQNSPERKNLTPYKYNASDHCCDYPQHGKRFSSPNSRLSREQLDALQKCIEEANDLLRSLGNDPNPENRRQLQLHFLQMRGLTISVGLAQEDFDLEGRVKTAGRDFVQIEKEEATLYVPYERLVAVKRDHIFLPRDKQKLISIDSDKREELVLNFGEFVAKRSKLVNLFFGNFLYRQLNCHLGRDILVRLTNESEVVGELVELDENKLTVLTDEQFKLPFEDISFIVV